MDLSALIFVALAVAWAVYLIPMALKHSDDAARSRRIDRFSGSLRVLARHDAVRVEEAPAAAGPDKIQVRRPAAAPAGEKAATAPTKAGAGTRTASAVAARRRRRVLGTIALANVALVALASASVIAWPYVAITAGLLVAWLVACRLMVKRERTTATTRSTTRGSTRSSTAARPARPARRPAATTDDAAPGEPEVLEVGDATEDIPVVPAAETGEPEAPATPAAAAADPRDPSSWDLRPVPLPTYVGKATAGRAVRTIDLDSTGVWTSGRKADDSQIAREAEEAARAAKSDREATERRRATGS